LGAGRVDWFFDHMVVFDLNCGNLFESIVNMTVSTENATSPKSTKSREAHPDSSVSRGTNSKLDFV